MKTLALFNLKGGVGKTAAAVNLAHLAALKGFYTLLWDLDGQSASSWYLQGESADVSGKKLFEGEAPVGRLVRPTPYARLDQIPSNHSYRSLDIVLRKSEPPHDTLRKILRPLSEQYSLTVLDCPPSLSSLAHNVFAAADLILVPVIPTWLSIHAYEALQAYFEQEGLPSKKLKPFFSMADRRRALHRQLLETPPAALKHRAATAIPYASTVERMGERRAPIAAFAPAQDAALLAYAELWAETECALAL